MMMMMMKQTICCYCCYYCNLLQLFWRLLLRGSGGGGGVMMVVLLLYLMLTSSVTSFVIQKQVYHDHHHHHHRRHPNRIMMIPSSQSSTTTRTTRPSSFLSLTPFSSSSSSSSRCCRFDDNNGRKFPTTTSQKHHHQKRLNTRRNTSSTPTSLSLLTTKSASAAIIISPIISGIGLGSVVLIHELGHYIIAKLLFNIPIKEFSIGMGPKLFGFQALGNVFNFRALPLGGYVRMAGSHDDDDDDETEQDDEKQKNKDDKAVVNTSNNKDNDKSNNYWYFENRPWSQKVIVLSGGIVFNFIFAFMIYFGIIIQHGYLRRQEISLVQVAHTALKLVQSYTTIVWKGYQELFVTIMLLTRRRFSLSLSSSSIPLGSSGNGSGTFVGPIRIISTASNIVQTDGIISLLWFMAHISINLGIVNALPIPGLDGGKIFGTLLEAIPWRHQAGENIKRFVKFWEGTISILLLGFILKTIFTDLRFLFL